MDCIKKFQDITRVWDMRLLSLYGKIVTFKSLVLSKIIYIAYMSNIWYKKRPNIKHSTLIGDDSKGGLKDIDILSKFKTLLLFLFKEVI